MRRDRRPHGNAASVSSHEQAAWTTITATLLSCDRFRIHADARIRYGDGDVLARDDLAVSGDIRLVDVRIAGLDGKSPTVRHRIAGVHGEIDDRGLQFGGIGFHAPQSCPEHGLHRDRLAKVRWTISDKPLTSMLTSIGLDREAADARTLEAVVSGWQHVELRSTHIWRLAGDGPIRSADFAEWCRDCR